MNKIQISKTDANHILDAWAKMSMLCSYLESSDGFTERYKPKDKAGEVYIALSNIVTKISPQLNKIIKNEQRTKI